MRDEVLRFRVMGFNESGDCEVVTDKGKNAVVDPFVGCAWEYDNKEALLDTWFEADGFWHKDGVFLPREGLMKVIATSKEKE